jgi:aquaporin Z
MELSEAVGYWTAQFLGGIIGALVLWGIFSTSPM